MGNRTGIKFRGDVDGGSFGGAVQACIGKLAGLVLWSLPSRSISPSRFNAVPTGPVGHGFGRRARGDQLRRSHDARLSERRIDNDAILVLGQPLHLRT